MNIEITKEDMRKILQGGNFAEVMAEKIVEKQFDHFFGDFKDEIRKGLDQAVKDILEVYLKELGEEDRVLSAIKNQIRQITKEELIKILIAKDEK